MFTLKKILEQTVFRHPHREALVCPARNLRWTYGEWNRQVNRLSNALLAWGLAKGERVSAFLGNTPEFATTLFAAAKAGAVFNPINCHLSPAELTYILNDAESRVLIFDDAVKERVKKALPRLRTVKKLLCVDAEGSNLAASIHDFTRGAPDSSPEIKVAESDWFSIAYTSGTTGRPKGVIHRHREIIDHGMCMIESQKLSCFDRGLSLAPLYHAAELHCFFLPRVSVGAANILHHDIDPVETWSVVDAEKITVLFADPPTWGRLIQYGPEPELRHFRLAAYGGSPMPDPTLKQLRNFLRADLIQYYGMAEMGPAVTVLYPWDQGRKAGSAGLPLLNHEIRVVQSRFGLPSNPDEPVPAGENGEVLIRGAGTMQGYYNRPEKTAQAFYGGWYHSGDLGRFDLDGYLWISGRLDDAIITGVDNVYPQEIEAVLKDHPGIQDAAVAGLAGERGEKVLVAFVVSGDAELAPETLDRFMRESDRLAAFKIPARYLFVRELPRTATGKLKRHLLKCK